MDKLLVHRVVQLVPDDAVRLSDHNPTNSGGEGDGTDGKLYVIDGVC